MERQEILHAGPETHLSYPLSVIPVKPLKILQWCNCRAQQQSGRTAYICGSHASPRTPFDIWLNLKYINDVQLTFREINPVHSEYLDASFCSHWFDNRRDFISVPAVPHVTEPFDSFNIFEKLWREKQSKRFEVFGLFEAWTCYTPSRYWDHSTSPSLVHITVSSQVQVSYICSRDESFLSVRKVMIQAGETSRYPRKLRHKSRLIYQVLSVLADSQTFERGCNEVSSALKHPTSLVTLNRMISSEL